MRPRPARRRVQPWAHQAVSPNQTQPARKTWFLKLGGVAAAGGAVLLAGLWLLASTPIDCLTTLHTFCTDEEVALLQDRYPHRWANLRANPAADLSEFQKSFADWEQVEVFLSWTGRNSVLLTRSETIAHVRIGEQTQEVLSHGQLRPSESSTILIQFESQQAWESWLRSYSSSEEALQALKTLAHDLQTLRPRPTVALVKTKDEVELRLENSSRATIHLHSAGEVQQQLRTLQAVFTSSTMEQQPGEVDVRFKNVITR